MERICGYPAPVSSSEVTTGCLCIYLPGVLDETYTRPPDVSRVPNQILPERSKTNLHPLGALSSTQNIVSIPAVSMLQARNWYRPLTMPVSTVTLAKISEIRDSVTVQHELPQMQPPQAQ